MNWIEGWDRQQVHLLPPRVEDYVEENNPVRFLDVFVEGLDLRGKGFKFPKENAQGKGHPAYRPGDLLKLYLYGYLHGVRSSRKLEKECGSAASLRGHARRESAHLVLVRQRFVCPSRPAGADILLAFRSTEWHVVDAGV